MSSDLLEDEGGAGASSPTSNVTTGVKNPILPMHKVARRKKEDLETIVEGIVMASIQEAYQNTFLNKTKLQGRLGQRSAKPTFGGGPTSNSNAPRYTPVGGNPRLKVYYKVPFKDKEAAKASGLMWDPKEKMWYGNRHNSQTAKKWPIVKIDNPDYMGDMEGMFEALNIPNMDECLNKRRHTMPQLSNFDAFKADLKESNIDLGEPKDIDPKKLAPTQSNFNEEKVDKMISEDGWKSKPIIVSNDDYVIDGHHRWLAAAKLNEKIPARVVDKTAEELLDFVKDKSYIEKRTIKQ